MSNNIRPLTHTDSADWLQLWRNYVNFYQETVSDEVTNNTLKQLLAGDEKIGCLVACDENNKPIGMLTYIAHFSTWDLAPVCYLQDLYVDEQHRKTGVARKLLRHLTSIADKHHWSRVHWMTKPDNVVARTFYDQLAQGESWILYSLIPSA